MSTQEELVPASRSVASVQGQEAERDPNDGTRHPASFNTQDPEPNDKLKRTSRACSFCHRQKLRCDGAKPCLRCIKSKVSDGCEYLPSMRDKTRKRKQRPTDVESQRNDNSIGSTVIAPQPAYVSSTHGGPYPAILNSQMAYWKWDSRSRSNLQHSRWNGKGSSSMFKDDRDLHDPERPVLPSLAKVTGHSIETISTKLRPILPKASNDLNPLEVLAAASTEVSDEDRERSFTSHVDSSERSRSISAERVDPVNHNLKDASSILSLITIQEVQGLFAVFFKALRPHFPFIDPKQSDPLDVAKRSLPLFNAICIVSARAYSADMRERLEAFIQAELERFPPEKTIETIQANLLYAIWSPIKPRAKEQDLIGLRIGLAVRLCAEIGLSDVALLSSPPENMPHWAWRSIRRSWSLVQAVDRIYCSQSGIDTLAATERTSILISKGPEEMSIDVADVWAEILDAWSCLLIRAVDTFKREAAILSISKASSCHIPQLDIAKIYESELDRWRDTAQDLLRRFGGEDAEARRALSSVCLYDQYIRMIIHSFTLERALVLSPLELAVPYVQLQVTAIRLITGFETEYECDGLYQSPGAPDIVYTIVTYAAVSLLRCLDTVFIDLNPHEPTILSTIRKVATALPRLADSDDHLPALQAVYLQDRISEYEQHKIVQLDRRTRDGESVVNHGKRLREDPNVSVWPPSSTVIVGKGIEPRGINHDWVPTAALRLMVGSFGFDRSITKAA